MLNIIRGTTTKIAVTLAEKQTLTNPFWLWRFVSDSSNIEYTAIISELSNDYKQRSNLFNITEGGSLVLPEGVYTYYVYEQSSSSNTNYLLAITLCEVGQIKVTGTSTHQFTNPNYNIEYAWTNQ